MSENSVELDEVENFFTGLANEEGFQKRPKQIEMSEDVAVTLNNGALYLGEGGTGIGKSFAYLVPALKKSKQVDKPVIVSTETKKLQYQLLNKDLPFLQEKLDFEFTGYFGKSNYFCRKRFEQNRIEINQMDWADKFTTQEKYLEDEFKEEYEGSKSWKAWEKVRRDDSCNPRECGWAGSCEWWDIKRNLSDFNIIVINHHLLFANYLTGGNILPEVCGVVLDEAHAIPEVSQSFFRHRYTENSVKKLASSVRNGIERMRDTAKEIPDSIGDMMEDSIQDSIEYSQKGVEFLEELAEIFLVDGDDEAKIPYPIKEAEEYVNHMESNLDSIIQMFAHVESSGVISQEAKEQGRVKELKKQVQEHKKYWNYLLTGEQPDVEIPYTNYIGVNKDRRGAGKYVFLESVPQTTEVFLSRMLGRGDTPYILTSATLSVSGSFDYILGRLGVDDDFTSEWDKDVYGSIYHSPFDYEEHMEIFCPEDMPEFEYKQEREFIDEASSYIIDMAEGFQGRGLALFNSYNRLEKVADKVDRKLRNFVCYKQGDQSLEEMTNNFRDNNGHRCLMFATSSFWSGVDFQGDLLKFVSIMKLPFKFNDRNTEAYKQYIENKGGSSFGDFLLPEACLTMDQGVGRLIRSHEDTGIVAIFDRRFWEKGYGKKFQKTIPDGKIIHSLEESSFI